jgi:hypothetical protein
MFFMNLPYTVYDVTSLKKRPSSRRNLQPFREPFEKRNFFVLSFLLEPFSPAQIRARIQWAKTKLNPAPELVLLHVARNKQAVSHMENGMEL